MACENCRKLQQEIDEDVGVLRVWRGRTLRAEEKLEKLGAALGEVAAALRDNARAGRVTQPANIDLKLARVMAIFTGNA